MKFHVAGHPLLDLYAATADFPAALGELAASPALEALIERGAGAPFRSDDALRTAVRDLLRQGGFKPTGRSKPASEYLLRAAEAAQFPRINVAVDAGNAVSLHSGLPISVVDCERLQEPLQVLVAAAGTEYVFNPAGQTLDAGGLLCLWDASGPSASAVKDAQRTKTHADTRRTLTLIWGTTARPGLTAAVAQWYRSLLESQEAVVTQLWPPAAAQ